MNELENLASYLCGKVIIVGMGNTLKSDDGAGVIISERIKGKVPYIVYNTALSLENYFGKIIKDNPDNIIIIDAADFGSHAGDVRLVKAEDLNVSNYFTTHNASIELSINYLKSNLKADIIILLIQSEKVAFGQNLSPKVEEAIEKIVNWFYEPRPSLRVGDVDRKEERGESTKEKR